MLFIDGSQGEGGGQILRTSLGMSIATGQPVTLQRIRAGRQKPGLRHQHLACVRAAVAVGGATVVGATLGSQDLTFTPNGVYPGTHHFDIGTAGSTTLVLQTVLPALVRAEQAAQITVTGGTHNPLAPPFEFLALSFLPALRAMGPTVTATCPREGFVPHGGGRIHLLVEPVPALVPLHLLDRGPVRRIVARSLVSALPRHIAERELAVVANQLGADPSDLHLREVPDPLGPANLLLIEVVCDEVTAVFSAFGRRGVPAEKVAKQAADAVERFIALDVPVEAHLADQLLVPMALAGSGTCRTVTPTLHTRTNAAVLEAFGVARVTFTEERESAWRIEVRGA